MQLFLAIACALLVSTDARSSGAPVEACVTQMPGHGPAAQTADSPYTVAFEGAATYTHGTPKMSKFFSETGPVGERLFCEV